MPDSLKNFDETNIMLSNDDGYRAPGLKFLRRWIDPLVSKSWVYAPEENQSCKSHSLTMGRPVSVRRVSKRRFAVDGTPVDSVIIGTKRISQKHQLKLVISGINLGHNLGEDIAYSGTVAAAREAAILGYPAIAFSQEVKRRGRKPNWEVAKHYLPQILRQMLQYDFPPGTFINVNFPDRPLKEVTGIHVVPQGRYKVGDHVREVKGKRNSYWLGDIIKDFDPYHMSDYAIVQAGGISITPIRIDTTHRAELENLAEVLGTLKAKPSLLLVK